MDAILGQSEQSQTLDGISMKHDELRAIAHNIADSLASGMGFPIGVYYTNIFEEAQRDPEGYIAVDFLKGTVSRGTASDSLKKAISLYRDALEQLCEKHGASIFCFQKLDVRYSNAAMEPWVIITIEDENGKLSTDEYKGLPLKRIKTIDSRGRVRTER